MCGGGGGAGGGQKAQTFDYPHHAPLRTTHPSHNAQ